ncbi:hypothetical protein NIES4072_64970 [Nostoc commune NIES-4072]|uniref:Contractile injection system tube protein N-terminal domain-containing protein n=1 Tax=Nostoc commune NIES-4072 TaxID=2005467 RepID=A0A2R5FWX5_NOSCO|nr:hypothetical protein [Nostoc commune]BBD70132.1 hypothetical protein NIES4070_65430 [Nostoc commune HK-02]GBG22785.1 hypothetical protein NIES4072_64970 [Nostoc commune NIES-4072]
MPTSSLVKAKLIACDKGVEDIEFMYNPTQLDFGQSISLNKNPGARTGRGLPKVTFAYPEPCTLNIRDIFFDTYEDGTSVLTYISKFQKAVDFAQAGEGKEKRPPIYIFTWGEQQYIRCFVTSIIYSLMMFLPDGTPVRAKLDLTLEEVDESTSQPGMGTPANVNRTRQR